MLNPEKVYFQTGGWLVTKKDMAKAIAEEMGLTQRT